LLLFPLFLKGQLHTYRNFNHLDGLNISGIESLEQDKKGYLWIGTAGNGLIRYDGEFFKEFEQQLDIPPLHVSDIVIDKNETFYLSTLYSGIIQFKNGKYKELIANEKLKESINHIELFGEKLLFFGNQKVYITDKKGKKLTQHYLNKNKFFKAYQYVNTPNGVLTFTDQGAFFVTGEKTIPLVNFYKKIPKDFNATFAEYRENRLTIYDATKNLKFTVNYTRFGNFTESKCEKATINFPKNNSIQTINTDGASNLFLFSDNSIKSFSENRFVNIVFNSSLKDGAEINTVYRDNQNTIWLASSLGLGRVSVEPFTKINFDPIYSSNIIGFIDLVERNKVLLSFFTKESYTGVINKNNSFVKNNFSVNSGVRTPFGYFIGTNEGLKKMNFNGSFDPIPFPDKITNKLMALCFDGEFLYCSNIENGLFNYSLKTKQWKKISIDADWFPKHFYTALINFSNEKIYFGSSKGLYEYTIKTKEFKFLKPFNKLGSFVGTSTKDKYGTLWFTFDNGIGGISKSGEYFVLDDTKIFSSKLFYTLTSDLYGNLIVGTNKGISMIKVTSQGQVLDVKHYDSKSGFSGYETNMRAALQLDNISYVGTIEGLYQINSELLENTRIPQNLIVLKGRETKNGDLIIDNNSIFFTFKTLLSLNQNALYSYRIKGYKDEWSDYSEISEIEIENNLSSGTYTLEVQASYDGVNHSEIIKHQFTISQPFWKSKWFLFSIILLIGIVNIFIFEANKRNAKTQLIDPTEISIEPQIALRMILSTVIISFICTLSLFLVDSKSTFIHLVNIIFVLLQFLLWTFGFITNKKNSNALVVNRYLITSFYFALFHFYILAFLSYLEIYSFASILVLNCALPYVFSKIKSALFFGVVELLLGGILLISLEQNIVNINLFLLAVVISLGLSIILSSLRIRALEKLIFINNVLNNGNLYSVAFDNLGQIMYCSTNISQLFNTDSHFLIGKPISILNAYVVTQEMREFKLLEDFKDGKIFVIPFYNKHNEIRYLEWSCKKYGSSVNVLLGVDVTEKLQISTNYQSIVEYADDIIYNTDINGNILFVNDKGARTFGYRSDNLIGKSSTHLVHPEYREAVIKFYNNQFESKIHNTYHEFPLRSKDGRVIWVGQNVTMTFEPGSRKRISGFVALARDITEKRMNEMVIEQQTKDIKSNIDSARSIQENLLPKTAFFNQIFPENFVFYKPKEIVSGDFYFVFKNETTKFFILGDCSGTGVSGAFFSILGVNLIKLIIVERKVTEPAEILAMLIDEFANVTPNMGNFSVKKMLKCVVFSKNYNQASISTNGLLTGHISGENVKLYRNTSSLNGIIQQKTITVLPNDVFYFSTDGYLNQIGGLKEKQFGIKRMEELMVRINDESLQLQRKHFENTLRNWKDNYEQTDDVTLIGIRCTQ
ncbi:MAG: PAS domain S-box protein, partial [Fluviicola sp.]